MGLLALFNPGGVVIAMCIQCVKRRDELPQEFVELLSYLAEKT